MLFHCVRQRRRRDFGLWQRRFTDRLQHWNATVYTIRSFVAEWNEKTEATCLWQTTRYGALWRRSSVWLGRESARSARLRVVGRRRTTAPHLDVAVERRAYRCRLIAFDRHNERRSRLVVWQFAVQRTRSCRFLQPVHSEAHRITRRFENRFYSCRLNARMIVCCNTTHSTSNKNNRSSTFVGIEWGWWIVFVW